MALLFISKLNLSKGFFFQIDKSFKNNDMNFLNYVTPKVVLKNNKLENNYKYITTLSEPFFSVYNYSLTIMYK